MCSSDLWNAASACGVQLNLSDFFINWYKGRAFSPNRPKKRLREARQPVNFWTSRRHLGNLMFSIARILVGFASIPRLDTRKPSNLPAGTPNVHLSGLSFSQNFRRFANVSLRSSNRVCFSLVLMTMSSTYTCTFLPI